MTTHVTLYNAREFTGHVSGQTHAMAGAVIALSAAQAVSLGLACLRIGQTERERTEINRMETLLAELLELSDRDADAIAAAGPRKGSRSRAGGPAAAL